jgi:hypothetical protein
VKAEDVDEHRDQDPDHPRKEMNIGARGFLSAAGMSRRLIVTRGVGTALLRMMAWCISSI